MESNHKKSLVNNKIVNGKRPAVDPPAAVSATSTYDSIKRQRLDANENRKYTIQLETRTSSVSSSLNKDEADPILQTQATSIRAENNNKLQVDPVLLQHAKNRLSKFAARLFDPNRPKVREIVCTLPFLKK
jgi:hypothetical protein